MKKLCYFDFYRKQEIAFDMVTTIFNEFEQGS